MPDTRGELSARVGALVDKLMEMAATDHAGHYNRLFKHAAGLYTEIETDPDGINALRALLDHPDAQIQLDVARHLKCKLQSDEAIATLERLAQRQDEIGREARSSLAIKPLPVSPSQAPLPTPVRPAFLPLPQGLSRDEAMCLIRAQMPGTIAEPLFSLLRPSIRLWPRPDGGDPLASRFGGMPAVPAGFAWPFAHKEPMWFLAQINCADLGGTASALGLPGKGLLAFFGDHDDVNGCGPVGGGCVRYFAEVNGLAPAALPLDDFEPQISCGVDFYESWELPDADAEAMAPFKFSREERAAYLDLRNEIAGFMHTDDAWRLMKCRDSTSKLLGWPDLIQYADIIPSEARLLLQLGEYHDGAEWHGWGPGGLVYFVIRDADLAAGSFECAELEMQCT
jgi:uncharacterized protein YwqG